MKIKLEAFSGSVEMDSGVIDVPENTTQTFEIALSQAPISISRHDGSDIGTIQSLTTRCTFRFTGRSYHTKEGDVKIYALEDIRKA